MTERIFQYVSEGIVSGLTDSPAQEEATTAAEEATELAVANAEEDARQQIDRP